MQKDRFTELALESLFTGDEQQKEAIFQEICKLEAARIKEEHRMKELSRKQGMDLIRKLRQSTEGEEIFEIAQQLGMDLDRQMANECAERNRRTAALDEPQEN